MKNTLIGAGIAALAATSVSAGGIERASNDYGFLFGEGTQLSFGVSFVNPNVSGDYPAALGGGGTGNMSERYVTVSAAYKMDLGENLSFGLFRNNGYGADASYTQGVYTGLRARWESDQTALVLKYQIGDRISVYGGARYVKSTAEIAIPELLLGGPVGDYTANGSSGDWGYVVGAAYEIPDIALRVALTYESSIEHAFSTTESFATLGIPASGTTKVTLPQSISLDFQTGVAPGTLVFGKIKWAEWSKWEIRTPGYESVTGGEVTGLDNDTITYNLGVGRQFNENMSGFAQVSYEKSNGGVASRLAPTDGSFSFGVGGQYSKDNMKVRGGVQYVKLGDATDGSGVQFTGNSAIGFGMQVSFSF